MTERHATRPVRNAENIDERLDTSEDQTGSTDEKYGTAKQALSETWYQTTKFAKHAIIYVLILPTDMTLSLSKGFHNAPKLYHDATVEPIPSVTGISTGFRAAGTVSVQNALNSEPFLHAIGIIPRISSWRDWISPAAYSGLSAVKE
jgi:hypothetical protein